jgi:phosphate ABC transporter phosphate-binding protein
MFRSSRRAPARWRRYLRLGAAAAMVALAMPVAPAGAAVFVPISGAGSTWSQNALDQWRRNVTQYGMQINYQGTGSSDGRNQFRNGTVDFAVSEIPYGLTDSGVVDYPPARKYAYMPIVAGGTAFMYNLKINGRRVTNLRLSGLTVTRMFTGEIKMWNDPAIKADNPGLRLPARRVVPVVRSDGSGTTAQFTLWMSKLYGSQWNGYCGRAGLPTPCGLTSEYPVIPGSGFTAQAGSLGVSGYVAQDRSEGAITYVEYSYALNAGFPIAKLLNKAGYYVEPNASNVAVALLAAGINKDLTQKLDGVYGNPDRRTYPLSSYSYMILPTAPENGFSADKGQTLSSFAYYFLCEGQQQAPLLGYSPLPINLVQAGLTQVRRIPGVNARSIDIAKCNNPTFTKTGQNRLAQTAPFPPACDRQGGTQCSTGTGGAKNTPTQNSAGAGSNSGNGGGSDGGRGSGRGGGQGAGAGAGGPSGGPTASRAPSATGRRTTTIDPDTGQAVTGTESQNGDDAQDVVADPVAINSGVSDGLERVLMVLAGLLFVGLTIGPPLLSRLLGRRRSP